MRGPTVRQVRAARARQPVARRHVDPLSVALVRGSLLALRQEMASLVQRTAMSPVIREKEDYFVAIFDGAGRMVHGTNLPLGTNLMECILEQYPADTMRSGDLYGYNDPYLSRGGVSHTPDMVFAAPVFSEGRILAFSEAWGHFQDIGARVIGTLSPSNTDIFHEGIRVPPVLIQRDSAFNEDLLRCFLRNSRLPDVLRGDTRALMAAVRIGERRLAELAERLGASIVEAAFESLIDESEIAARARLCRLVAEGTHAFEDFVDNDGISDRPYRVAIELTRHGDRFSLDLTKTDDQAPGPINFITHESVPKLVYGLYLISDDDSLLLNEGLVRAIDEAFLRDGSLLQPRFPAPLVYRTRTLNKLQSCAMGTLAVASGGQTPAASPIFFSLVLRVLDASGRPSTVFSDGLGVGLGARPFADGTDAIYFVAQKNMPVEFEETEYPFRVERYALHCDSGGPGRFRGGCGVVREVRILAERATLTSLLPNVKYPPWGVRGGKAGRRGVISIAKADGENVELSLSDLAEPYPLHPGDLVRAQTTGGGGWGHPFDREPERVQYDVLMGAVSRERAAIDYGVVLDGDRYAIDRDATERLRSRRVEDESQFDPPRRHAT